MTTGGLCSMTRYKGPGWKGVKTHPTLEIPRCRTFRVGVERLQALRVPRSRSGAGERTPKSRAPHPQNLGMPGTAAHPSAPLRAGSVKVPRVVSRLVPERHRSELHRNLRRSPETRCRRSGHLEFCLISWQIRGARQSPSMPHLWARRAS